jgi:hypothetical protein
MVSEFCIWMTAVSGLPLWPERYRLLIKSPAKLWLFLLYNTLNTSYIIFQPNNKYKGL